MWGDCAAMAENGNPELTTNQRKALDALLRCTTIKKAALAAGLAERTMHRYLDLDHFRAELARRQDATIKATTAALVGLSGDAVQALRSILQSKDTPAAVKVRAALGWLAQMRQSVELADLAERVSKLEELSK